jgi:predicted O-linked N-acetylglucosamine transferase (SPINDLY family)
LEKLVTIDEFSLSPTFYLVYQGFNDVTFLTALHAAYAEIYPPLRDTLITPPVLKNYDAQPKPNRRTYTQKGEKKRIETDEYYEEEVRKYEEHGLAIRRRLLGEPDARRLRVGFVSAHIRKHSICKLFCGLISGLDPEAFEVFVFATGSSVALSAESQELEARGATVVRAGMTVIQNRQLVSGRGIEILIFLDVGMDPSTAAWAGARLAPLQLCVWGHPTTTGLPPMDYYISSEKFHR